MFLIFQYSEDKKYLLFDKRKTSLNFAFFLYSENNKSLFL